MVKSIFTSPNNLKGIKNANANHLIITFPGLEEKIWNELKETKMKLSICINAFGPDGCPANPDAQNKLFKKINDALKFQPDEIWIDHFRFDGRWETGKNKFINMHSPCKFCKNKSRLEVLKEAVLKVKKLAGSTKVGYFAVPFKTDECSQLVNEVAQDHGVIGKMFDLSSPMLYLQMINKPVSYASDYVKWMSKQTGKPILPIIQIKYMPDDLEDKLSEEEIQAVFNEAIKPPSIGVSFFCWDHAIEKNKTGIIKKLFTSI